MPVEVMGMVTTQVVCEAKAPAGDPVDPGVTRAFARAHEDAGFDRVLIGYSAVEADAWLVASFVLQSTSALRVLIAHRPGFIPPTLAARKAATLDRLHGPGRVALNIVTGGSEADQGRDGDFLAHDDRYRRTAEFIEVLRRCWQAPEPFDHTGEFYRLVEAFSVVRPAGVVPVYFAGASEPAIAVGARLADVYMMWAEPLHDARERIRQVRTAAAAHGRPMRFALAVRIVLADTEPAAWARAERIARDTAALMTDNADSVFARYARGTTAVGAQRLRAAAARGEVLDTRLWTTIARITGAPMNTTALVGTTEQVAEALLAYYDIGFTTLLIRGFDPLADITGFAELVRQVRTGVTRRDHRPT